MSLELGDFEVARGDLGLQLLFADLGLVEFLAGSQHLAVDGGNKSKGDGVDGIIDVRMGVEKYFCHVWGDGRKLLLSFLVCHGKVE